MVHVYQLKFFSSLLLKHTHTDQFNIFKRAVGPDVIAIGVQHYNIIVKHLIIIIIIIINKFKNG